MAKSPSASEGGDPGRVGPAPHAPDEANGRASNPGAEVFRSPPAQLAGRIEAFRHPHRVFAGNRAFAVGDEPIQVLLRRD